MNDLVELLARGLIRRFTVHEHLDIGADRGQRRAQLVAGLGDEIRLILRDFALTSEIVENRDDARHVMFVVFDTGQRDIENTRLLALARADADLVVDMSAIGKIGVLAGVFDPLAKPIVTKHPVDRLMDRARGIEAEDPPGRLVDDDELVEGIRHEHRIPQRVEDGLDVALLGLRDTMANLHLADLVAQDLLALREPVDGPNKCTTYRTQPIRPDKRRTRIPRIRARLDIIAKLPKRPIGHDPQRQQDARDDDNEDAPQREQSHNRMRRVTPFLKPIKTQHRQGHSRRGHRQNQHQV